MLLTIFFPLIFVAVCSGQSTTTFVPKSACGIGALGCFNNQQDTLNTKLEALDFAGGCQIYKSIITCMTNVGNCATDTDFTLIRQQLDNLQDGICGVDGSILLCGKDIHVCFTEMDSAMAEALVKNISSACQLISKFVVCANNVTAIKACPDSLISKVKEMEQSLNQQNLGCDGSCPQAIAKCTENASTLPTDQSILTMDLTTFCQSASKVHICLNNLTTSAACSSSPQSYLTAIAENELTKIGDICNQDGSISPCVKSLTQCAADLSGIEHGADINARCMASSEFLECISKLPCTLTLAPLIAVFRRSIETVETGLRCPSVGSCNERFAQCGLEDQGFVNMTSLNKEAVCKAAAASIKCFDFVKNDPICINEKNSFASEEQEVSLLINDQCGVSTTGPTTTAFVPKSVCGIGALKCFSDQYAVMDDKFQLLDYASACQYFKSIVVCLENVGNCSSDPDFDVVRQQLLDEADSICGIDGSVNSCGSDIRLCFTAMDSAVADALVKNFSQACLLIAQFAMCAKRVINMQECPDSIIGQVKQIEQAFVSNQDMKCGDPCLLEIESCTADATTLPTSQSILTIDLSEFCRSANKVSTCLNNLTTSVECVSSSLSYLKDVAKNELTKVGDVCSSDGGTTPCVKNLIECAADLTGISHSSDTTSVCKAASMFLECISQLPCITTLAPMIANFRNTIETDEVQTKCPSVGSCNDRWTKCGKQEQGLVNVSNSNKDLICKTAETGIQCFDYVKSDPLCINEQNKFITQYQSLKMLLNTVCGGGGGASWFVHLPLFVAALMASLKQYF